jgi:hypothetical protein
MLAAVSVGCDPGAGSASSPAGTPGPTCPPLTRDLNLEAVFPAEIDGQPVADLQSAGFLGTVCVEGGQGALEEVASGAPDGIDLARVAIGSIETEVEGTRMRIVGFRLPGATEQELRATLMGMSEAVNGDSDKFSAAAPTVEAGGKTVKTWVDAEGRTSYVYAIGDIVIVADAVTPSQADRIFAAFP